MLKGPFAVCYIMPCRNGKVPSDTIYYRYLQNVFLNKMLDVGFVQFLSQNVLGGLESIVLNSVISFHLAKSMNKYCMMVVNYWNGNGTDTDAGKLNALGQFLPCVLYKSPFLSAK